MPNSNPWCLLFTSVQSSGRWIFLRWDIFVCGVWLFVCFCILGGERDWQVSRYPESLRQLWGHHCGILGLIEGWLESIRGEGGRQGTAVAANYYYPHCSIWEEFLCRIGSHTCGLPLRSAEVHGYTQRARVGHTWQSLQLLHITESQEKSFSCDTLLLNILSACFLIHDSKLHTTE